jgi:hypothetical protein
MKMEKMEKMVGLSKKSQTLIDQYITLGCPKSSSLHSFSTSVDTDVLVSWLYGDVATPTPIPKKSQKEIEFIIASLRAELLRDLLGSMETKEEVVKEEKPPSKSARLKFYLIAIAGTVLAACEGFDSISTLLGVFALPSTITLLGGCAFAALSVMVFYGFNLAQVSKNLGVKITDAPKLLDLYLLQMGEIKSIRKKINNFKLAELSTDELKQLASIITMLQQRLDALIESSKQFDSALNTPKMKIAKNLFVGVAGLLFFGGGFFAGQSVGVFLLGLVVTGITPTFLPVILFSVAVGLAAFSLYWYVEKVGLQQLISGFFGLDEEKIKQLCDSEEVVTQVNKLSNLKERVESTAELTQQITLLKQQQNNEQAENKSLSVVTKEASNFKVSNNIYSFHQATLPDEELISLDEAEQQSCTL